MKLKVILHAARRWLSDTPHRALERAYKAALAISKIENDHFNGQKISAEFSNYSDSIIAYFQRELQKYLRIIRIGLAEFKLSHSFLGIREVIAGQAEAENRSDDRANHSNNSILDKLNYIDRILTKYERTIRELESQDVSENASDSDREVQELVDANSPPKSRHKSTKIKSNILDRTNSKPNGDIGLDKIRILPRSLFRTFNRIGQDINPKAKKSEEEIVKQYRLSRNKTIISLRFILILIIIPLLTHQLSKNFIIKPIVERYFEDRVQTIFINTDLEEEAYEALHRFEEKLRFKNLTGLAPELTPEQIEEQVKSKAREIMDNSLHRGSDAISNVFADVFSLFAFAAIVAMSEREITIVKSFLDNVIYGLSDSAKAFIIILLTDIFVGFHSPHGWEIILESISRHFGLPENRDFNFLFIATFPVILDTVMKYWIFRYLNRISPSAVATYRNMNE